MATAAAVGAGAAGAIAVGAVVSERRLCARRALPAASCIARPVRLQPGRWKHAAARPGRAGLAMARPGGAAWRRALEVCCKLDTSQSLGQLAFRLERCFAEVCVENAGRPAAAALKDFVECVLQLGIDESGANAEGHRLTAYERRCRSQWINAIYVTLSELQGVPLHQQPAADNDDGEESSESAVESADEVEAEMEWLLQLVRRTISGQATGDEQSNVKFDRSLATGGHSGGVASEKRVIAPQWVPISQLVLLTMKVMAEADAAKGFS
eukprot:jgi/Chlat1/8718/Chrsp9S08578